MRHRGGGRAFIIGMVTVVCTLAAPMQPDTARLSTDFAAIDSISRVDSAGSGVDTTVHRAVPPADSCSKSAEVRINDPAAQSARQPTADSTGTGSAPAPAGSLSGIAVVNFFGRGSDSATALGFSDRCRLLLSNYSAVPVMGFREMEDSLTAHQWGGGDACDHNDCLLRIGTQLGVRYIIGGSAGKIGAVLTLAIRLLDVRSGKVLLFKLVDTRQEIGEVLAGVLPGIVVEFNNRMSGAGSAIIAIQSEPSGAAVEFDQTPIGTTPLFLKNVKEGAHDLRLSLEHHREIVDTLTLDKLRGGGKRYVLKLTDKAAVAYRDKRQVLWAIRGVGFLGGISALSAGLYYNSRLGGVEAAEQKIIDENKASGNTADASLFAERFRDQSKRYERLSSYRNMCYTAGVLLAAGVGVTWLF